jgi:hypothetical protein
MHINENVECAKRNFDGSYNNFYYGINFGVPMMSEKPIGYILSIQDFVKRLMVIEETSKLTLEQLEAEKNEIEARIEKLKKEQELVPGMWYFIESITGLNFLFKYREIKSGLLYGKSIYLENHNYEYNPNGFYVKSYTKSIRPATDEEMKDALIKVAEKKGFKVGCTVRRSDTMIDENGKLIIDTYLKESVLEDSHSPSYFSKYDSFMFKGSFVYSNGEWADIIEYKIEKKIDIGGYEVECYKACGVELAHTKIDGYMFTKEFWQAAKLISEHDKAKIMVGCSKQFDVGLKTINKILSKL